MISSTPKNPVTDRVLLWCVLGASHAAFSQLTSHYGSAKDALQAGAADWGKLKIHASHIKRCADSGFIKSTQERLNQLQQNQQLWWLCEADSDYPAKLGHLFDPPPVVFGRGNPKLLHEPQVAVVGTRSPTPEGKILCSRFTEQLAQASLVITSGLAGGIDACAHKAALLPSGARTVAVLGSGADRCYPQSNLELYQQILDQGGTVISELPPGTAPMKHHFPRRNRLIAALGDACLVVEAAERSGSLITANLAAELGRQVFATPGSLFNKKALGCLELIREGASLCYRPEHLIEELNSTLVVPLSSNQSKASALAVGSPAKEQGLATDFSAPDLNQDQLQLLELIGSGASLDELCATTGKEAAGLSATLSLMELEGLVVNESGRYVCSIQIS